MANLGLYYPYIQFKEESWLKLAALYWDQMARIVPTGFPLDDADGVRLLVDEGFVFDEPPTEDDKNSVAVEFEKLVSLRADDLAKNYGTANRSSWDDDPVTVATEPGADPKLAYVYPTKMVKTLPAVLRQAGLAEWGPSRPDVGLGMHPRLADVYMLALARVVSSRKPYQPVTDETRNHIAISACTAENLADALLGPVELASPPTGARNREVESALLNLCFEVVMPARLEHVSMKKIVALRADTIEERARFQDGLRELVSTISTDLKDTDAETAARIIAIEFEKKVRAPLDGLRAELDRAKLEVIPGAFALSALVPAGTLLGTMPGIYGVSAALGLGLYKLYADYRKKTADVAKSKLAYLVRLEQRLSPSALGAWIGRDLEGFSLAPR
jgi:hypothetical protein